MWRHLACQISAFQYFSVMINAKIKKRVGLVIVFALLVLAYYFAFIPFQNSAMFLFIPLFFIGIVFFKQNFTREVTYLYPILWLSMFLFILLTIGAEKLIGNSNAVSFICITYFTWMIVKNFWREYFT